MALQPKWTAVDQPLSQIEAELPALPSIPGCVATNKPAAAKCTRGWFHRFVPRSASSDSTGSRSQRAVHHRHQTVLFAH